MIQKDRSQILMTEDEHLKALGLGHLSGLEGRFFEGTAALVYSARVSIEAEKDPETRRELETILVNFCDNLNTFERLMAPPGVEPHLRALLFLVVHGLVVGAHAMSYFNNVSKGALWRRRKRNAGAIEGARRRGEKTRSLVREQVANIIRECRGFSDAKVRSTLIGRLAKDNRFARLDRKMQLKHIAAIRAELDAERSPED
jgi:hypothetical protein